MVEYKFLPHIGSKYYTITHYGLVMPARWQGTAKDWLIWKHGMVFRTAEDAEEAAIHIQRIAEAFHQSRALDRPLISKPQFGCNVGEEMNEN